MKNYKYINNTLGFIVLLISLFTYTSTLESSASLWDCGEFIAGAYKLQVVHPPGAPLFLMIGRMFTLLAGDDVTKVAWFVNFFSGLSTALAVMFIFWITTSLGKKIIIGDDKNPSVDKIIAVMGGGLVGALAANFSDTLWFSAVEGEVYAFSLFFIAIALWGVMKWEENADDPNGNKWLLFIAYMLGLSIGVHLLSLLVVPIIALIYYFKKYPFSVKGTLIAMVAGFVLLGVIQVGIIQILTSIAASFEYFAVNTLGLPFNFGIGIIYTAFFLALVFLVYYSHKIKHADLQIAALSLLFIMIGFSSYLLVPIRANANPPINMNAPKDAFSLMSYLNREQYGDRPLLYGPQFTAKPIDTKVKGKDYFPNKETGKYDLRREKLEYVYNDADKIFFPRMYSSDQDHIELYRGWADFKGNPTFADNIKYFVNYQIGYMWWRYFMWNFAGRQDDFQGTLGTKYFNGNWLSGISFLDDARIGSQEGIPVQMKEHKARNYYYLLPFLFGLIGFFFFYQQNSKWAAVFLYLFFITGILLIVYNNSPPREPRERDYTLVGSFITYCMFIGLGVMALYTWLKEKLPATLTAIVVTIVGIIAVPTVMAQANWDDHDRSDRTMAVSFARNYLESCPPNAILFTQGDNDTYPLWYAQEVEGIRTDVRVTNLSLLGVDWYIEQLFNAINDAAPVPFHKDFSPDKVWGSNRDIIQYFANKQVADPDKYYPLADIMTFLLSENKSAKARSSRGEDVNYLPTKNFTIPVDVEAVKSIIDLPEEYKQNIVPEIRFQYNKNNIIKYDLAVLAMLAGVDWSRPICFANTCSPSYYQGIDKYLIQEGLIYRFVPIEFPRNTRGAFEVNENTMFTNVMEKFTYGGLDKKEIFVDENSHRMMHVLRGTHVVLADKLNRAGDKERSIQVLERMKEAFIYENTPYFSIYNGMFNLYSLQWIDLYYRNDAQDKVQDVLELFIKDLEDTWRFFNMQTTYAKYFGSEMQTAMDIIKRLEMVAKVYKDDNLLNNLQEKFPTVVSMQEDNASIIPSM